MCAALEIASADAAAAAVFASSSDDRQGGGINQSRYRLPPSPLQPSLSHWFSLFEENEGDAREGGREGALLPHFDTAKPKKTCSFFCLWCQIAPSSVQSRARILAAPNSAKIRPITTAALIYGPCLRAGGCEVVRPTVSPSPNMICHSAPAWVCLICVVSLPPSH